jgi:PDZ domain-containing protein
VRDQRGPHRTLLTLSPLVILAISLYLVDLPLFVEAPGRTQPVLSLIDIDGTTTYDSGGKLLLTTINVGRSNLYEALRGWLDDDMQVVPEREVIPPGQTEAEYERVQGSLMDQSKIAAVARALRRVVDYPLNARKGVIVHFVVAGTPAEGKLFTGDVITAVDGEPLGGLPQLKRLIGEAKGRTLELSVEPLEGGTSRTVNVKPVPVEDGPVIGISGIPNFPVDVRIESGEIGGPSAGLMWAVGVADLLTREDLTGGRVVAGTGTVDLGGGVGPVGGIHLKILAAERAGAHIFLLPHGNLPEARRAGDMELVPVATVAEAIEVLESR